jgi:peptidoglycan/LPS O-acetylase OafA/YrhL
VVAAVDVSSSKAGELRSLTGLRAVAATAVFVTHVEHWVRGTELHHSWEAIRYIGICGVIAFFVLSGYLLAQPGAQRGGVCAFWRRRAARILPVYWLCLALMTGFVYYQDSDNPILRPLNLLANVLLVQSWGPSGTEASIDLPAWSLSVEFLFYVLLPLLVVPLQRVVRRYAVSALAVLILLTQLGAVAVHQGWVSSAFPPAYLPVFLLGVYAAVHPVAVPGPRVSGVIALLAVAAALPLRYFGLAAVALAVLISSLAAADSRSAGSWLQRPWMGRFGVWSYAFFLLHVPVGIVLLAVISEPTSAMAGLGLVLLQLVLAWAASAVLFHWFEEPARRRLVRPLRRSAAV